MKPWQLLGISKFRYYANLKQARKPEKISFGCVVCCDKRYGKSIYCKRHARRYPAKKES